MWKSKNLIFNLALRITKLLIIIIHILNGTNNKVSKQIFTFS
jgi:hypothetical protein